MKEIKYILSPEEIRQHRLKKLESINSLALFIAIIAILSWGLFTLPLFKEFVGLLR